MVLEPNYFMADHYAGTSLDSGRQDMEFGLVTTLMTMVSGSFTGRQLLLMQCGVTTYSFLRRTGLS